MAPGRSLPADKGSCRSATSQGREPGEADWVVVSAPAEVSMAELSREGDELVVHLSVAEKAEALHGDIRVPMSSVRQVEVVDDAVHTVNAFTKSVGAAWPGLFVIGTFHSQGSKVFAVVHHSTPSRGKSKAGGEQLRRAACGLQRPGGGDRTSPPARARLRVGLHRPPGGPSFPGQRARVPRRGQSPGTICR